MRRVDKKNNYAVDRSSYVQIQTPQVFKISELKKCMKNTSNYNFTDEASLFDEFDIKINLVEGSDENIKITTEKDLNYFS
jgi:2-C-methyl-D-erythritol 4-phosphate cytidylyltransferase